MLARVVGMHKVDFESVHSGWIQGIGKAGANKLRVKRGGRLNIRGREYAVAKAHVARLLVGGNKARDAGGRDQRDVVQFSTPVKF